MNDILNFILKDTYTLSSLKHRLRILKSVVSAHLFGGQPQGELSSSDSLWLSTLPPILYQQFNKNNVAEIFDDIESKINHFKTLTMYLPFEVQEDASKQIGDYVRKNFSSLLLLDIKFDPNLIAGCALSWNGIYRDYSLRSKIQEKKDDILESFKKFLR